MEPIQVTLPQGTIVIFQWKGPRYNVNKVDQKAWSTCVSDDWWTNVEYGPYVFTLPYKATTETYYFACGVNNGVYCNRGGMKAAITAPGPSLSKPLLSSDSTTYIDWKK